MKVLLIGGPKDIDGRLVDARDDYPYIDMEESSTLYARSIFQGEEIKPTELKIHRYVVEELSLWDRGTCERESVYIGVLEGMSIIQAVYELFWSYNDTKSKEALRQKFSH